MMMLDDRSNTAKCKSENSNGRDEFDALFANWLSTRAALLTEEEDERSNELCRLEEKLARQMAAMPAPYADGIWFKIEILKRYMPDTLSTDQTPTVLFASIEADLWQLRMTEGRRA